MRWSFDISDVKHQTDVFGFISLNFILSLHLISYLSFSFLSHFPLCLFLLAYLALCTINVIYLPPCL